MCYLLCGNLLVRLGMPEPDRGMNDVFNRKLEREHEYDRHKIRSICLNKPPHNR